MICINIMVKTFRIMVISVNRPITYHLFVITLRKKIETTLIKQYEQICKIISQYNCINNCWFINTHVL